MKDVLPVRLRFGSFELNPRSGELCSSKGRQVLQEQPLLILRMLIERDGELVSRNEIKNKLWPNDTVVEFDHSIHAAISNLRKALNDSADQPKYIETIPRRGYRLMTPVECLGADEPSAGVPAGGDGTAVRLQPEPGLIGKKVSHYRVLQVLGGGGMGMLYKAEDLKLGRQVALKFLPEELASDPLARQRFEREARTASSLNHPNICTIYEVEEHETRPFIVMELLEGQTLRDRLAAIVAGQENLALDELLEIATQICCGLEAAHAKGIIHRDIKPANIFITEKNVAKILDFGVAKVLSIVESENPHPANPGPNGAPEPSIPNSVVIQSDERSEESKDPYGNDDAGIGVPRRRSSTDPFHELQNQHCTGAPADGRLTPLGTTHEINAVDGAPEGATSLTRTGMKLGTAGYMSPEQVRGEVLDARTDIFSFGLVLYEMATGKRAFAGETAAVVQEAIVCRNPVPIHALNSTVPPKLETIVDKALGKECEGRYQTAAEMLADLLHVNAAPSRYLRARWNWYPTAGLLLAVVVVGSLYWRSRTRIRLTPKDTIVVAHFINTTGDTAMDGGALDWPLTRELQESPYLSVLYASKVSDTLKLLGGSDGSAWYAPWGPKLTPEQARQVCLRSDSRAYVTASIANAGNFYHIALNAVDCHSGRNLASVERETTDRNRIIKTLGTAGHQLRRELGEPEDSLKRFNTPLEQETSWSLDALQAHDQAWRLRAEQGDAAALPQYKRAVELDPNLTNAYLNLASIYMEYGDKSLKTGYANTALKLSEGLSPRSRWYVEAVYYTLTGELDKASATYAEWELTFPADPVLHQNFSSCLILLGQLERAALESREAVRLTPKRETYSHLLTALIEMNRLEEAKAVFEEARARGIDELSLRDRRYTVAFLETDTAAMQEQLSWGMERPEAKAWALQQLGDSATYHGRFRAAREFYSQMISDSPDSLATFLRQQMLAYVALSDVDTGSTVRARQRSAEILYPNSMRTSMGLIFARIGDVNRAEELVKLTDQESPLGTLAQKYELPSIRAAIALYRGHPEQAQEILQTALPYDLARPEAFPQLYAAYLRGLAYLELGKGREAAAEFQRIIDHPGIVADLITGPLSHLQLGRAQVMMGDKDDARMSYQDFLTLWKDADPDIPIYRRAKAEYAKLQ